MLVFASVLCLYTLSLPPRDMPGMAASCERLTDPSEMKREQERARESKDDTARKQLRETTQQRVREHAKASENQGKGETKRMRQSKRVRASKRE